MEEIGTGDRCEPTHDEPSFQPRFVCLLENQYIHLMYVESVT